MPPLPTIPKIEPKLDDLGYEIPADAQVETPKADAPPAKPEDDQTGYTKPIEEPAKVDPPVDPAKVDPPAELTEEEKNKKELSEAIKDLGTGYDKDKIIKFAVDNKLNKAQLEAYVNYNKAEDAAAVKKMNDAKDAQRKQWKVELENDPEFGGEHFDKNVASVNKVLNSMPNTKKVLTEKGSMLPPYIMRDLLGLSKTLNPTTPFVGGDAPELKVEDNFIDDFYK